MTRTYTTAVDISDYADVRREALLAHATQVDPTSPFWFGLPPEVARTVHPVDEYILARSLVGADRGRRCGRGRPLRRCAGPRRSVTCPDGAAGAAARAAAPASDADDPGEDDMSKWLTQEWLDETRKMAEGQPERPGASARMQYVVTGGSRRGHRVLLDPRERQDHREQARPARRRRGDPHHRPTPTP